MSERERIDTLIKGWYVVTMNPSRDIIRHGAVAVRGKRDRGRGQSIGPGGGL